MVAAIRVSFSNPRLCLKVKEWSFSCIKCVAYKVQLLLVNAKTPVHHRKCIFTMGNAYLRWLLWKSSCCLSHMTDSGKLHNTLFFRCQKFNFRVTCGCRKVADGIGFLKVFARYSVCVYHLPLASHHFVSTDDYFSLMDAYIHTYIHTLQSL